MELTPLFRSIISLLFAAALAMTVGAARAQSPTPAESSLTMQVEQRAKHRREIMDLMRDKDPATRSVALEAAMRDPDQEVRDLAIGAYLSGFKELTPVVIIEKGGTILPEDAPQIGFAAIAWATDGKSFTSHYNLRCPFDTTVQGQLAGGKLSVQYTGACLSAQYRAKEGENSAVDKPTALVDVPCTLVLAPNNQGNELDGDLECLGISTVAKARLAFGD